MTNRSLALTLGLACALAWASGPRYSRMEQRALASLDAQMAEDLIYDPAYTRSGVPKRGTGVCTDVVLRMALDLGVDIRRSMTADVARNRARYGLRRPDPAIDHRRSRYLIHWFRRHAITLSARDPLRPGDVVFYRTGGRPFIDHVGVVGRFEGQPPRPTLVHHWPGRPVEAIPNVETWDVVGRFRLKVMR